MQPDKMTPDAFIATIVSQTASVVLNGVKDYLNKKPVQEYAVLRQTPTGPVTQQTTLPQMLAELTDQMKVSNEMMRYQMQLNQQVGQEIQALRMELEENRKLAQKITKRNKRKIEDDEDDE